MNPPLILPPLSLYTVTPQLFSIGAAEPADQPVATTYLGTPVFDNLIFLADSATPENRDLVINDVIITVDQEKIIVKTPISGRKGKVKEYISLDDYSVFLDGLLVSPYPDVYPKDLVIALKNLLELDHALGVASDFLQIFSIHSLVIERVRIGQQMGMRNTVPFQIQCSSDEPIDLREI